MRNIQHGSRGDRRAEGESAQIRTIRNIVRRLGVVLGAALDACIHELLEHNMVGTAENLRDELKPFVDALVHFEVGDHPEDVHDGQP